MTLFDNGKCFNLEAEEISQNNNKINIYYLNHNILTEDELNKWAISIRNNYIPDGLIDDIMNGISESKKEYIQNNVLPDYTSMPGKITFTGEFGEILFYDYITFVLNYDSPRRRYRSKSNKNTPIQGSDVIGYKVDDVHNPDPDDTLLIAEVKTRASSKSYSDYNKTIKDSIIHSRKDRNRIAESLYSEKSKLLHENKKDEANIIARFQNKTDTPFLTTYKAVAILNKGSHLDKNKIQSIVEELHDDNYDTDLIIIYSDHLLELFKDLHRRACNC